MEIEMLIKETYRFAAQNYPMMQNWRK
jgi:hypothetical protein